MNKIIKRLLLFPMMLGLSIPPSDELKNDKENKESLLVDTKYGTVEGFFEDGVKKFYGVPFAKPPLGELRFVPPQDLDPWDGVVKCTVKPAAPLQMEGISNDDEYSEDCLYLNIWSPPDAIEKKNVPVLIFIHGGAFMQGSPNMADFDGSSFARDGVIQVNLAYRLGALGFTAFEEIEEEYGYLGNAGLLDLLKGMQWVHENIEAFGGDINNITICGESAGSMLISNLVLSRETKGLFNKVIMQSGSTQIQHILAPHANGSRGDAIKSTKRLMAAVGAKNLDELRKIDGMQLVENALFSFNMTKQNPQYFFPTFDGKLVPERPFANLVDGKIHGFDLLAGLNADEGTIFIPPNTTKADYHNYMNNCFREDVHTVEKRFPVDDEHSMIERLRHYVKMGLDSGAQTFADVLITKGHNVYMYKFKYCTEALRKKGVGTYHGFELPFVFDNLPEKLQTEDGLKTRDNIHRRWLNFIINGNPNHGYDFDLKWPKYRTYEDKILEIDVEESFGVWPLTDDLNFLINNTNYPYRDNFFTDLQPLK